VDFLICLQKDLVHRNNGAVVLAAVCQQLYQVEVIEEEGFMKWWNDAEKLGDEEDGEMKNVRERTQVFIDWLQEAEEDDSSEEESD